MSVEPTRDVSRRSLVSRLRGGLAAGADGRPHYVVCGSDALVYTVAEELAGTGQRVRVTVIVPPKLRPDIPDLTALRGVRVIHAERLDERIFRTAGLAGADALALVQPDDVVNLHAALCAQSVEPDLRLVIRMFNTGLGYGVRRLFADCAVLSDAAMAAPAFVAAALGEVAPTHFRHARRTLYVARREDVRAEHVVCSLARSLAAGPVQVLPPEPAPGEARPDDLVLAEATGTPTGAAVAAQRIVRDRRRRRPALALGRAVRAALSRKLGIAVLSTLLVLVLSGAVLAHSDRRARLLEVDLHHAADRGRLVRCGDGAQAGRPVRAAAADPVRVGAAAADHRRGRRGHGERAAGALHRPDPQTAPGPHRGGRASATSVPGWCVSSPIWASRWWRSTANPTRSV